MKKKWIEAALIRAVKTSAQAAVAMIGTGAIGVLDIDWLNVMSVSVAAGILSILTSIAGLPEVDGGTELPLMDKHDLEDNYWGDYDGEDPPDQEGGESDE